MSSYSSRGSNGRLAYRGIWGFTPTPVAAKAYQLYLHLYFTQIGQTDTHYHNHMSYDPHNRYEEKAIDEMFLSSYKV